MIVYEVAKQRIARMKLLKTALSLMRMKKWCGGIVVIGLALVLVLSYSLLGTQPQKKQSAYDFFRNHPANDSSRSKKEFYPVGSPHLEGKKFTKPSEKPLVINVKGLSDLYTLNNISKHESKTLLTWAQLRFLLSRSDALPEAAQGIEEASVAWKDLLSRIELDNAAEFGDSKKLEEDKKCPFSVSSTERSGNGSVLNIPCGLVQDSSLTVVGIPHERNGSFQIELRGSQLLGESKPPVVLHYYVSLPGEIITEKPFIVQNTWTNEQGWGREERCPSHRSADIPKVDGLVLCNEQVVRSMTEKDLNASHPSSGVSANVSTEHVHISANFPFTEGNPFTATLWTGSEGFHMTVNGRHETSFPYREKLEPWLVSGVSVAGGVDVFSALAKGLPVSEDDELIVDVELLKAPPVTRKRLIMLVGVFSTGNNFERRMALRRSWMQYEAVRTGDVAVRFFIGLHKSSQVNYELWKEAQAYGDVQLMPFVDYYTLITLKTVAICIMGTKILPAKYIMKTDDDAFVRIDEVLNSLKEKGSRNLLYGLISFDSAPHRDKESKWYISKEEWAHDLYPPWAHGPGYVVSRDIAKFIVRGHQEGDLKLFKLEDVAMGIWIEEFKKRGQEVNYMSDDRFNNAGCESNYVLAHYQSPRLVLCLWEKLQKEHEPHCCE